jgi:hypothetical protein
LTGAFHDPPPTLRVYTNTNEQTAHGPLHSPGRRIDREGDGDRKRRQSPQRATLLMKGGGTAWLDCNVSSRSGPIYNHAVDRSRESGTFSVLG